MCTIIKLLAIYVTNLQVFIVFHLYSYMKIVVTLSSRHFIHMADMGLRLRDEDMVEVTFELASSPNSHSLAL